MTWAATQVTANALRSDAESTAAWTGALAVAERINDPEYKLRALRGLYAQRFASVAAEREPLPCSGCANTWQA